MEGDNTERENKVQKFSDFAKDKKYLTGDKKDIKEILNCPMKQLNCYAGTCTRMKYSTSSKKHHFH